MQTSIKAILVSLVLTAGACGGGSDGKDLPRFVGIWAPTAGTQTSNCGGQPNTSAVSGNVTWSVGSTSDLVQASPLDSSCIIHADVDGDTASSTTPVTCTAQSTDDYGGLVNTTVSLTAYTFALSADGETATENFSGTILQTDNTTGSSVTCTLTETAGSYQKQ
ncbi:MAG TPA: hypothetical protein VI456_03855 [Polyangia bacterium]